ncbi:hypothetical protein F7R20_09670 [Pseudomonas brassicacearum subsp. brassicacearum]|nr:hypothetical protein F7R20_09670 [Pseudomonas brassicacearum subsp. brassicacearum]QEO80658.1 hypothetical protein ELZ14_25080 [Pseudomonas brassicacearum]
MAGGLGWGHGNQSSQWTNRVFKQPQTNVGASLLAIAVCQSTSMLNIRPSSRASSLPQWFSVYPVS